MKQTLSSSIDSSTASSLAPSSHVDTFTRDHLPPKDQWPVFVFDRPEVQYPDQLNCVQALLDEHVAQGRGDRMAVRGVDATGPMGWSYAQLQTKVNQIAHVLVHDMGLKSGERLLLRGGNSPMMAACFLAALKAGLYTLSLHDALPRSEERRVGKECMLPPRSSNRSPDFKPMSCTNTWAI